MYVDRAYHRSNLIDASAQATAAGVTALTPTLGGGSVGKPVRISASGTVGALVTLNIGNNQSIALSVNPNAPPAEKDIPSAAFSGKVNSVSVSANLSAAGVVNVIVSFAP